MQGGSSPSRRYRSTSNSADRKALKPRPLRVGAQARARGRDAWAAAAARGAARAAGRRVPPTALPPRTRLLSARPRAPWHASAAAQARRKWARAPFPGPPGGRVQAAVQPLDEGSEAGGAAARPRRAPLLQGRRVDGPELAGTTVLDRQVRRVAQQRGCAGRGEGAARQRSARRRREAAPPLGAGPGQGGARQHGEPAPSCPAEQAPASIPAPPALGPPGRRVG